MNDNYRIQAINVWHREGYIARCQRPAGERRQYLPALDKEPANGKTTYMFP
jgi:hypothetical protein